MDPKVNGQIQNEWRWQIAIYLFLGGVGGGAYTIGAINSFLGESLELSTTVGLWIAFPALLIGTLFLLSDLGSPSRAPLAILKPGTSWISRGTWIITIFMGLSLVHLILHQFTEVGRSPLVVAISIAGIVFAIGTMAYTGILLGASKGIPFWRSGAVPVVFVISATVTGHFAIMLGISLFFPTPGTMVGLRTMALEATGIVVLEVLAILFYLQEAFRSPDAKESAERLLRKRMFVFGYFIMGLAAPLLLMIYAYRSTGGDGFFSIVSLGAVLGLIGGLILRQAVLMCGALPTLNMAGFKFRRIHRAKEAKPDIGLMPPS